MFEPSAEVSAFWLVPIAFATSTLTGVIGLGGGVLLIMVMPGFIPAAAILPLHAMVQFASNASRVAFAWRHLDLEMIPWIVLGGLAGTLLGGSIYQQIDPSWLPLVIGSVVLIITWIPLPQVKGSGNAALLGLGFYQAGIGMLSGGTGPLGAAVLLQRNQQRDWLVINTGSYMAICHAVRSAAYLTLGFTVTPYLLLLGSLIAAVVLGSWVGTWLRSYVPEFNFALWFKLLVTVLALRILLSAVLA